MDAISLTISLRILAAGIYFHLLLAGDYITLPLHLSSIRDSKAKLIYLEAPHV